MNAWDALGLEELRFSGNRETKKYDTKGKSWKDWLVARFPIFDPPKGRLSPLVAGLVNEYTASFWTKKTAQASKKAGVLHEVGCLIWGLLVFEANQKWERMHPGRPLLKGYVLQRRNTLGQFPGTLPKNELLSNQTKLERMCAYPKGARVSVHGNADVNIQEKRLIVLLVPVGYAHSHWGEATPSPGDKSQAKVYQGIAKQMKLDSGSYVVGIDIKAKRTLITLVPPQDYAPPTRRRR